MRINAKIMLLVAAGLVGGSDSRANDGPAEEKKGIGAKIRNRMSSAKEDGMHRQPAIPREKGMQPADLIPLAEDDF